MPLSLSDSCFDAWVPPSRPWWEYGELAEPLSNKLDGAGDEEDGGSGVVGCICAGGSGDDDDDDGAALDDDAFDGDGVNKSIRLPRLWCDAAAVAILTLSLKTLSLTIQSFTITHDT